MSDIAPFLSDAGLSRFISSFLLEGVDSVEDIKLLSDADMKELGLKIGERNRLKKALSKTSESHDSPAAPTEEERKSYLDVFEAIDTDNSGEIDFDEFVVALKKMDIFESETKARRIFNQADEDGGGTLDRDEFLKLMHGAKNGKKSIELAKMAEAGKDVLDNLQKSLGVTISVDEAVNAPITDKALAEVEKLKTYSWVRNPRDCDESNCTFVFNVLVLDLELVQQLMGIVCVTMLEETENKLQELGISGFIKEVNVEAVVLDGLRGFVETIHRFSHTTTFSKDSLTMDSSEVSYLHSLRKTVLVVAANDSVQDVRNAAADLARKVYGSYGGGVSSRSFSNGLATAAASGAAGAAVEVGVGEVLIPIMEAAVSAGCSIM